MVSKRVPSHFDAPSLAGCSLSGTAHLRGTEGGLGDLQRVAEQLQAEHTNSPKYRTFVLSRGGVRAA